MGEFFESESNSHGIVKSSGAISERTKKFIIIGSILTILLGILISVGIIIRFRLLRGDDVAPMSTQSDQAKPLSSLDDSPKIAPHAQSSGTVSPSSSGRHNRPNTPSVSVSSPDSDGDGLSDAAEVAYRTDPSLTDTDGDGYSDFSEIQEYGTDPLDATKNPDTIEGRYHPNKSEK